MTRGADNVCIHKTSNTEAQQMFTPKDPIVAMTVAAQFIARERHPGDGEFVLVDPSNDDILVYAAEYCDDNNWPTIDLTRTHPNNIDRIVAAFDNARSTLKGV